MPNPAADQIATMPFAPILPPRSTVLMMGTLPPTEDKWAMPFFYPNFYNDMWRIYGLVFFDDAAYFQHPQEKRFQPDKITAFLHDYGIGLCSSISKARRLKGNASDKFLQVIETVDLHAVLQQLPDCRFILASGGLAAETLLSLLPQPPALPKSGQSVDFSFADRQLQLWRLPSSSRAYPLSVQKKADAYRRIFQACGFAV